MMPTVPSPRLTTMFRVLLGMQFARLRKSWRPYIVVSAVMPAGIVLLLHLMTPHMNVSERQDVISGAMLLSEAIASIVMLSQYVAWLHVSRALDHYRVLPISLEVLVLSLTGVYGLFAWPGIALIGIEGVFLDHLTIRFGAVLIPLLLVTALAMGAIGIIIGLLAPDEGIAGLVGNLVMMAILFLGMVPAMSSSRMPWLWILPSTGSIAILRHSLFDQPAAVTTLWTGELLYAFIALSIATYFIKRPS
ncbi:MAG: ABC transporter permease [Sulfobacillus sp.]|nr:ABC transporter permease [Sulfobacillus sp.]